MWVIDFEASGLSKKSYPIEVGITDGTEHYSSLIRPLPHWMYWEEQAEKVHNISLDEIIKNGKYSLTVATELNHLLKKSIVYCDNIQWDGFWLNVLFSDNGLSPTFQVLDIQDILKTGQRVIATDSEYHLDYVLLEFGGCNRGLSSSDIQVTCYMAEVPDFVRKCINAESIN